MPANAQISKRLASMLAAIDAPPAPTRAILLRASTSEAPATSRHAWLARSAVAAAIFVAVIFATVPVVAPGVVQSLTARIAALLQWTPPPAAPKAIHSAMVSRQVTLAQARKLVAYSIVPPAGLPRDVVAAKITATPTAVYSKVGRTWKIGVPSLTFAYRRAHGREFGLLVDGYDARTGFPPKYIYNADEPGPDGLPKRYESFAWRNGDQITSAIADSNLSKAEIDAIRIAMRGTRLRSATTRAELNAGSIVKMYGVP